MQWFKNLKVSTKLFMSFGALLAITALVGGLSLVRLQLVAQMSTLIADSALPKVRLIGEISTAIENMRKNEYAHISVEDPKELKRFEDENRASIQRVREDGEIVEKLLITPEGKAAWVIVKQGFEKFSAAEENIFALSRAEKNAEALMAMQGESRTARNTTHTALDQLTKINSNLAAKTSAEAKALYSSSRTTILIMLVATIGIGAVIAVMIGRAIGPPLGRVLSILQRIATGHLDNVITSTSRDEVGLLLTGLDSMQTQLKSSIDAEREVSAENSRIRQALDKVSTNVVLADSAHKVVYLNDTAQATFSRVQNEIRKSIPSFDAAQVRGTSLETLSPDPSRQSQMLHSLSGSQADEQMLGGCTFRTVTSPVVDDNGNRIGTVMEWTDRTLEVVTEKELQSMLASVLGGDLTRRIELNDKSGFFEAMSRGVNNLTQNMADMIGRVKGAASEVYRGADEIAQGNANLSQRTEQQSSSLEQTASSMEEMTSTVKQNADNAGTANQLASAARDHAEKGGGVTGRAVKAMAEINDSSKKISDIIGVIDEIAFQTNLLALNAAVEAARAGEQGRGFAVVATEVRSLASRSASAAKEIKNLIQDSVRKVEDGSLLVTQSGQTLEQIVAAIKKVSDIVAEIAAASREQSSGIEQVNKAVMQMDEMTQQNAALVEQATAASQSMSEQARELNEMMGKYKLNEGEQQSIEPVAASTPRAAERRTGAARPWSAKAGKGVSAKPAEATASAEPAMPAKKQASGGGDAASWEEF